MLRKNTFLAVLIAAFIFSLALFVVLPPAGAAQDIAVYMDGEKLVLDQPPALENGRTFVPLRAIFEALGAEVAWDGTAQTVTARKEETTIQLQIGSHTAYRNAQPVILDAPAKIVQGRTLVPLRFVSEALGAEVNWDGNTRVVTVRSSAGTSDQSANVKTFLKVHFIDVGQADSILVQLPDGKNILIDGGNNADGLDVVSYLKTQGVKRLDYVVATHPHEDHIGGLDAAIDAFEVGKVYAPRVTSNTQTYEDFLLAVQRKGLKISEAKAGVTLDAGPGVTAVFVAPNGTGYDDLNNYSAVLRLTYDQTSFLFAGDAEAESEVEMLQAGHDLKADVLKVGHHGSDSSTSPKFLAAVGPKYAVISVGAGNDYGHPSPDVLARLAAAGVDVYRTDEAGTVVATSDGRKITFDKAASPVKERAPDAAGVPAEKPAAEKSSLVIQNVDLQAEKVTIANNSSQDVDLSGWKLISEQGEQTFTFPPGTVIPAGSVIKVVSGPQAEQSPGTLVWSRANIWNNDGDPAALYDVQGRLISRKE